MVYTSDMVVFLGRQPRLPPQLLVGWQRKPGSAPTGADDFQHLGVCLGVLDGIPDVLGARYALTCSCASSGCDTPFGVQFRSCFAHGLHFEWSEQLLVLRPGFGRVV